MATINLWRLHRDPAGGVVSELGSVECLDLALRVDGRW